jgi:NAD(P)H-hydrate epimerase
MKVVTAAEMKQLEAEAEKIGIASSQLMENAGLAVACETRRVLSGVAGKKILALVGPGNNGGDGEVAARHLCEWGGEVTLSLCSQRPEGDINLKLAEEQGAARLEISDDVSMAQLEHCLASADVVIDAFFGTGQSRPIEGLFQQVLFKLAEAKNARPSLKIIAVDLPSGLNSDNG